MAADLAARAEESLPRVPGEGEQDCNRDRNQDLARKIESRYNDGTDLNREHGRKLRPAADGTLSGSVSEKVVVLTRCPRRLFLRCACMQL